jgi:hypothetical protein
MARYRLEDGTVLDSDLATQSWEEKRDFDGKNHISRATGSQWEHETLYRSKKGRYWIEHASDWQGSLPGASLVTEEAAAAWLLLMERRLPEDLKAVAAEVAE